MNIVQKSLVQQGYNNCTVSELRSISNGLRFTPTLCMLLAIYGLYIQNPYWHFAIALLGILPFWFPKHHPFDVLYNKAIRHLVGANKIPPSPLPRRIACLVGGSMNIFIGLSFLVGNVIGAYIFGVILISLQIIVITTHFCLASYLYEYALKLIGKWIPLISIEEAKSMLSHGALLIDVRNPDEYANGFLDGAINIPLPDLESNEQLRGKELLLYCNSGMRSVEGIKKLAKLGHTNTYNLGSIKRWK